MSRSILFYPDAADALNKAVQEKIAPHLFLFCNYNPTPVKVFSTDGRFEKAVLNLYKLLIDSGVVNRIAKLIRAAGIRMDVSALLEYCRLANNLRTVLGHNVSEENGTGEEITKYERWLKSLTGKTEIECTEDYEKPLRKLEEIGTATVDILEDFVERASAAPRKGDMIAEWERYLIGFYCKETNRAIFLGQLYDAYTATHRAVVGEDRLTESALAIWIRDSYYRRETGTVIQLQNILDTVGNRFSVSVQTQIREKIAAAQAAMEEREARTASDCNCSVEELRSGRAYRYKDHYLRSLKPRLDAALAQIKQTGEGTMLPCDIMQMIIQRDFGMG